MPAVSILLPCFNSEMTLLESLRSLENQTFGDYELIAVDDGSSDGTLQILQDWQKKDRRCRVLSQHHKGIIPTLNTGLMACNAPYVMRMDADDIALSTRLEEQVSYLETNPDTAVVGCLVKGFPEAEVRKGFEIYIDWLNSLVSHAEICREIFIESPLVHPSVTYRREWVVRVGGYQDNGWAEDYDLWLRLYMVGARFAKVPRVLLEWRERSDRLTRRDPRYAVENFLRAKAYYLVRGPLLSRDGILIWGAGMMGRRISKYLLRQRAPLVAFIDIDPKKIGRTRRGLPITAPVEILELWRRYHKPALLVAVGARGARAIIREQLTRIGLQEGEDWWGVA